VRVTATVAAGGLAIGIIVNWPLGGSASSGNSLTVQVEIDIKQAIAELAELGFHELGFHAKSPRGTHSISANSPGHSAECGQSASREVRRFLTPNRCKEYASRMLTISRRGITTHVVITWVVMRNPTLARQYEGKIKAPPIQKVGNPPGQSPVIFTGYCFASHQNGAKVWAEQVQPTGNKTIDRKTLQAAAPMKLTSKYLGKNCTR
jgi:hypothetical protein